MVSANKKHALGGVVDSASRHRPPWVNSSLAIAVVADADVLRGLVDSGVRSTT